MCGMGGSGYHSCQDSTACVGGEEHSRRMVEAHQRDGIAMLGAAAWQLPEKSRERSQGQTLQLEGGLTPFPLSWAEIRE